MSKEKNTDLVKIDSSILKKVNNQLEITNRLIAQASERIEKSIFLRPLIIDPTKTTPSISCNAMQGIIEIKGRMTFKSWSDVHNAFYNPLCEWLADFAEKPSLPTRVNVQIEYLSSTGSLCLLDIFTKLQWNHKRNNQIVIYWYYKKEDNDMLETGNDYASIIKMPFKFISYVDIPKNPTS